jgi:hypothetical protein
MIIVAFLGNLKKSKGFIRGLIIFFASLLTFGGPTYMMLILNEVELPRLLILAAGLITLVAGLALFTITLKEENTSG